MNSIGKIHTCVVIRVAVVLKHYFGVEKIIKCLYTYYIIAKLCQLLLKLLLLKDFLNGIVRKRLRFYKLRSC